MFPTSLHTAWIVAGAFVLALACTPPDPTGDGPSSDTTGPAKSSKTSKTSKTTPSGDDDDDSAPAAKKATKTSTSTGPTSGAGGSACLPSVASSGSGHHHPGEDCGSCHDDLGDKAWTVAGTLFSSTGDVGIAGATIEIVGADGQTLTLQTADNGNFFTTDPVKMPLTVRASQCPSNSPMNAKVNAGSCNSCHGSSNRIHL
jgi:hypothetical protein